MTDKYCNVCGGILDECDLYCDFRINKESIGYGSEFDGDAVDMRLCCDCFDAMIEACAVWPIIDRRELII